MPDLSEDVRLQKLISNLKTELEQVKAHQEKSARHSFRENDEPEIGSYSKSGYPVPSDQHPASLRARRSILEIAINGLKQVRTPEDLTRVYRDLIGRLVPKETHVSTMHHNKIVLSLRDELTALMEALQVDPTPKTQTATQPKRM
jgi:hypothetical protein